MKYHIEFEIPFLTKAISPNSRVHWAVKYKENRAVTDYICGLTSNMRPKRPLSAASLVLTRRSSSEPDFDGLVASFKNCVDALIKCKIIENDKMSNIGAPTYVWEKAKKGFGSIRIEVKEL